MKPQQHTVDWKSSEIPTYRDYIKELEKSFPGLVIREDADPTMEQVDERTILLAL